MEVFAGGVLIEKGYLYRVSVYSSIGKAIRSFNGNIENLILHDPFLLIIVGRIDCESREVDGDVGSHAYSDDLEVLVANETDCQLVLWRYLEVRVLVQRYALLVLGYQDLLYYARVR